MTASIASILESWSLDVQAGVPVTLVDTPAYPLARAVEMPPGAGYPFGALAFRLSGLGLSGLDSPSPAAVRLRRDEDRTILELAWSELRLSGRYALEAKPDPVTGLDTGGNLLELPPDACRPSYGGSDTPEPALDPEKEQWLDQAREERGALMRNRNGQSLMSVYNEHNEVFDEVFRTSPALPSLWKADGATRAMAGDTSTALRKDDAVINDGGKIYNGNRTYNSNAFAQQLNVAVAAVYADPDFNPMTGPPEGSRYWEAARSALSFGLAVGDRTGNSKDSISEMTREGVYGAVDTHDGELPSVNDDQVMEIAAQGAGTGGAPLDGDLGWIKLDEEDRSRLRLIYESAMRKRAEDISITGAVLHEGLCEAVIGPVRATVRLADGAGPEEAEVALELPGCALDIDDSGWTGEVGAVARQRLEAMYFIRSLLHDAMADALRDAVRCRAAATLRRLPPAG
jgi:hypothetical protein